VQDGPGLLEGQGLPPEHQLVLRAVEERWRCGKGENSELGSRSQVGAWLDFCWWSIWCSQLSVKNDEKGKIETGCQIPNRILGHARRAAPREVLAAASPGMLDEAPAAAPLGLPAPLGRGAGTPFSPAHGHASFLSSGC